VKRTLAQLVDLAEPGWPLVKEWIAEASVPVEILPASERCNDELLAVQVTTRSPMGAIVHESGGLLLDVGWLKVLGGWHPRLPWSVAGLTRDLGFWPDPDASPRVLVVGLDVLGGIFAIDGGELGAAGHVHYFAPDELDWMDCEQHYTGWLSALVGGALPQFYEELRWSGWEAEVAALAPDQGISFQPMLWTEESRPLEKASRRAVPLSQMLEMAFELAAQLSAPPAERDA
jgi:hypothetical protein